MELLYLTSVLIAIHIKQKWKMEFMSLLLKSVQDKRKKQLQFVKFWGTKEKCVSSEVTQSVYHMF